jgi:hypothetical protein
MINIDPVDSSPHIGEVVGYSYFFWLSGTRTADAGRSTATYYISIDPVSPKDVPFGVFNAKNIYLGSNLPKTSLIFRPEQGFPA